MTCRRSLLSGAAATLATTPLVSCAGTAALAPTASDSLKDLASAKGLIFGSDVNARQVRSDADYRRILERDCAALVCENETKWVALRPSEAQFDFTDADAIAGYAGDHGMALRGHTLLWRHSQWFPDWLTNHDFGARPAAEAERLLTDHIRRVCAHYPQVFSWDVINETVDADTGELRETSLSRAMGQTVIDVAFRTAREAAPHAQLVCNDYMSWEVVTRSNVPASCACWKDSGHAACRSTPWVSRAISARAMRMIRSVSTRRRNGNGAGSWTRSPAWAWN